MSAAAMGETAWWQAAREQTPGCAHVMHLNNAGDVLQHAAVTRSAATASRICPAHAACTARVLHLCCAHNHTGAALQPQAVVDAVCEFVREEALLGGYEAAAKYAALA